MQKSTEGIYNQKINQVIDYISMNLYKPLQLDIIADKINMSQRQLLRIMHLALNEPLSTYIMRQRIERAVLFMQIEQMSLTQLAVMVGYDNSQSFSKAFKKQMGISPKAYMNTLRDRLDYYVNSRGNRNHNIHSEICQFEGLELIYIRVVGKYGQKESYEMAWNKLIAFLSENQALSDETRFIGLSFDNPNVTNSDQCRFYACASVKKKIIPVGEFGTILLREGKYAVYTLMGSYLGLQELYNNISINFEYNIRHGMAFEEYVSYSNVDNENQVTKVYIPIE